MAKLTSSEESSVQRSWAARMFIRVAIAPVRFYQLAVSPLLGPRCRFYPSCSAYAVRAVQVHGVAKGTALASGRLLRCHPWHPGGVDHVPVQGSWRSEPYVRDIDQAVSRPADQRSTSDRSVA